MVKIHEHIPSGYKPSPLGIIPEDWEVKRIGDFGKVITGSTPPTEDADNYGDVYKFVSPADISGNKYIEATEKYLSEKGFSISRQIPKGTVLFTCIGSTIGKCAIANEALTSNQQINAIICDSKHSGEFLYYELSHRSNRIKQIAGEQAVPIINKSTFENYKVTCPPFEEQKGIAEILSLWDTAIAKQTALIEQLTLRKRGLMQQLLTGKKRLKGFEGEWEEVRLGNLGKFVGGCVFSENEQGGQTGIPFYKVSDMNLPGNELKMTIANNYVTQEQIERLGYIVIEDEAIIFAKVGAAIALERKRYAKNFIIDNNMLAFIPNEDIWYMKYWFDSIRLSKYIQVGALPSYNASDLSTIKLNIPSRKEQTAIASVLVNADKEIETQKQKLTAMQEQKKGLMQVLLTGKRRITK